MKTVRKLIFSIFLLAITLVMTTVVIDFSNIDNNYAEVVILWFTLLVTTIYSWYSTIRSMRSNYLRNN
jgi:membrane-bound metal-dependent hydrolase YbcI (DUF457 family)